MIEIWFPFDESRKGEYNEVVELITEKNKHEKTDGGLTLLHIVGIYGGKSCPQIITYDIIK